MIVTLLNQQGGTRKAGVALQLAGEWALRGRCATLIGADRQGSAPDRSEQRGQDRLSRLFGVAGIARATLHRDASQLARAVDGILIDGPPRIVGATRAALLAADIVLIPMRSAPFDGAASAEMFDVLPETGLHRPRFVARFVLDPCDARSVVTRKARKLRADHDLPTLASPLGECDGFADAVPPGRLVLDVVAKSPAAREIADFAAQVARIAA